MPAPRAPTRAPCHRAAPCPRARVPGAAAAAAAAAAVASAFAAAAASAVCRSPRAGPASGVGVAKGRVSTQGRRGPREAANCQGKARPPPAARRTLWRNVAACPS
eukprot:8360943-Pyramimonas_sp.AAC.1